MRQDLNQTNSYDDISVDDILAEFSAGDSLKKKSSSDTQVFSTGAYITDDYTADEDSDMRIYSEEVYEEPAEYTDKEDYPAPGEAPYTDDEYSEAPDDTYEYSSEKRSARPSDDEIRDFIDAFKRGEFLDLKEEPASEPAISVDDRFLMGGSAAEKKTAMIYGDREIDMSADDDYEPPVSPSYFDFDDDEVEQERNHEAAENERPKKKKHVLPFMKKGTASQRTEKPDNEELDEDEYESEFADAEISGGKYAENLDYDEPVNEASEFAKDEGFFPASFKEYVLSLITSVLYRVRSGGVGTYTMEDSDEDLGQEVSCANAVKFYGSFIRSMRLRLRISGVILLIMGWISLGLPVTGMLKSSVTASAVCLGMELTIMLLCLDVVTGGIMNASRGKIGADTLAVISCLLTALDALLVTLTDFASPHLALCFISSCSLVFVMLSALLSCRALRKSIRVPAIGKRAYAVTGETNPRNGDVTILKSVRPHTGFVRRSEEAPPDETVFEKLSIPLIVLCVLLSIVIAIAKKSFVNITYILSAVFCAAVPFGALLSFSLPFFIGSMRIFPSGAAIAGWSGINDIGISKNLIVTDRDLFPEGTVEIEKVRIFANADPQKIIAYAGSLITAAGSCCAGPFGDLMEKNGCAMRRIENFEFLSGGGIKGVIDSSIILCGSTELMRLMNVRVPFRLVTKTSVLLAVDGVLYGIFNMKYDAQPQVRKALVDLMVSDRHPVFAVRDFNITPEMLRTAFDVATDGYDFPPYVERFAMSAAAPSGDSQIAAVLCREGLGPLVHMAATGSGIYRAARLNLLLTVISAILGVIIVAVKLLGAGTVTAGFIFTFMFMWTLPVAVISFFIRS